MPMVKLTGEAESPPLLLPCKRPVPQHLGDPRHLDSITDIAGYAGCLAEVQSDA